MTVYLENMLRQIKKWQSLQWPQQHLLSKAVQLDCAAKLLKGLAHLLLQGGLDIVRRKGVASNCENLSLERGTSTLWC